MRRERSQFLDGLRVGGARERSLQAQIFSQRAVERKEREGIAGALGANRERLRQVCRERNLIAAALECHRCRNVDKHGDVDRARLLETADEKAFEGIVQRSANCDPPRVGKREQGHDIAEAAASAVQMTPMRAGANAARSPRNAVGDISELVTHGAGTFANTSLINARTSSSRRSS